MQGREVVEGDEGGETLYRTTQRESLQDAIKKSEEGAGKSSRC